MWLEIYTKIDTYAHRCMRTHTHTHTPITITKIYFKNQSALRTVRIVPLFPWYVKTVNLGITETSVLCPVLQTVCVTVTLVIVRVVSLTTGALHAMRFAA